MQVDQTPDQDRFQDHSAVPENSPSGDSEGFEELELNATSNSRQENEIDVELHRSTAHNSETEQDLLETTSAQDRYLQKLVELLAPYDAATVQELDENRRPPLELLQNITEEGIFINGVPIPDFEHAAALLEDPTLLSTLSDEKKSQLAQLMAQENPRGEHADLMLELAEEGLTKAMLLCSMEIPRHSGIGIGTFLGVNNGLAAQSISKIGTPDQQALWLNALNRGVLTYGFGLTEEKVGSDPRSIITTFEKEQDEEGNTVYRLNGNKRFIGNAAQVKNEDGDVIHPGADYLVIYAVDDPEKAPKDRSYRAFMVPREAIGEENIRHTGGEHNKMGLREVNNGDFELHDVVVPESCLLGEPDQDVYSKMLGLLDITRLFVGGMGNGAAQAAVDIANEYAAEREQNGRPIEEFQMISFPLEDLQSEIIAGKLLNLEAAELVDSAERQREVNVEALEEIEAFMQQEFEVIDGLLEELSSERGDAYVQASDRCIEIIDRMIDSSKIKKHQGQFADEVSSLAEVTREIRDALSSSGRLEDFQNIKNSYKRIMQLAERVSELEDPVRFGTETAMSKLFNTELAERATLQAINTLGGYGFVEDPEVGLGLPKRLRDAKVLTIYEGTSNIQRNLIAQGMILKEIKNMRNSVSDGLRYFLLKFEPTKRMYYNVLKNTSRTKVERANAAYKYAVVDVMSRYQKSLETIKSDWKKNGTPEEYQSWDSESIERQQNLLASLPVQARMGVLADIAVQRKLLHLSEAHLTELKNAEHLNDTQLEDKSHLEHFQDLALEKLIALGRRLGGEALSKQERRYRKSS